MIVAMLRARLLGPQRDLDGALARLQDLGLLQPTRSAAGLPPLTLTPRQLRLRRQLGSGLSRAEALLKALEPWARPALGGGKEGARLASAPSSTLPRRLRQVGRWQREQRRLALRLTELEEERGLLSQYGELLSLLEPWIRPGASRPHLALYLLLLRGLEEAALAKALKEAIGEGFALKVRPLKAHGKLLVLSVPRSAATQVEALLAQARVEELDLPAGYGGDPLTEALPRLKARASELPGEIRAAREALVRFAERAVPELVATRAACRDLLAELEARERVAKSAHAFLLEGWLPAPALPRLSAEIEAAFAGRVTVDVLAREEWSDGEAPVVLANPPLIRPFERLVYLLPLPRYGSIDPTPFVAVFFPLFFGMMLGDLVYGAVLAGIALALRWKSAPGSLRRDLAAVAGACATFTVIFGLLYGELLGDLGRRLWHLEPVLFDREEAVVPFLALGVALGFVHIVLGLILGMIGERAHPRKAVGKGLSALMLLGIATALLAAFEVLPAGFFRPVVVGLLVAFPLLVLAEGLIAPLELLSTLGRVLSYTRVMAVGTASVLLAVVANRMVGAFGGLVVGVIFALLFHLVNFAIGLFSPALHALRLHYVEFFGTFYSPGGTRFEPFGRWGRLEANGS